MAKFEGVYPGKPKDAPEWFQSFYENYALVIKFLNAIGKRGISFTDNINSLTTTVRATHASPVVIPHSLGNITSVQIQGGRFTHFVINSKQINSVKLTAYLPKTQSIDVGLFSNFNSIGVLEPELFVVGDTVSINGQDRKITSIVNGRLSLDSPITLIPPVMVFLKVETLNIVLY